MQDLNHDFAVKPFAARTEAALASIEAKRKAQIRAGHRTLSPYAGINPKSPVVAIARLIVLGVLFLAPNYLLYMHVWGGQ